MISRMAQPAESFELADLTAELPDHTLEYILARVPYFSVGATRCVCKRWQALTTSSTFLTLCSERQEKAESWLYVNGFRYNVTDHTSPPATSSMLVELPAGYSWGAGNLAYTVAGTSSQLQYKLSPLDPQVRATAPIPAIVPAIVSVVRNRRDGAHMLIVVAGSEASEESLPTIAVFDSKSQSWSFCEDLPAEFRRIATSRSVSAVVCNGRLYLLHIYSGLVTSLDLAPGLAPDLVTRQWSKCLTLRPPGTQYCYLAVRRGSLVLVGVSHEQARFCFRGWNVAAGVVAGSMVCTGDSWPVVCHFGTYKPSGGLDLGGRRRRRRRSPSTKSPSRRRRRRRAEISLLPLQIASGSLPSVQELSGFSMRLTSAKLSVKGRPQSRSCIWAWQLQLQSFLAWSQCIGSSHLMYINREKCKSPFC